MINTVVVYGIARTDEDGGIVLECELYVDEMLATAACDQPPSVESRCVAAKVWEFTLVRNCVKSSKDAEEFFRHLNGTAAEVLVAPVTAANVEPRALAQAVI